MAEANGFAPRPAFAERARRTVTTAGSALTASMLRDMERQAPIEADHIIGDLIRRSLKAAGVPPLLGLAYMHLQAYEARRKR